MRILGFLLGFVVMLTDLSAGKLGVLVKGTDGTLIEGAVVTAALITSASSNEGSNQALGYQLVVDAARGWAMFDRGECETGLALMRESVKSGLGQDRWHIELVSLVASALGRHGSVQEALGLVDQTLSYYQHNDVHWWEAELYRVRGELLLVSGDGNSAEDSFRRALDVAGKQGAKSLELRAAISLARRWRDQGKPQVARELLDPIYDWFNEGFDTTDLKEVKALLEHLS